MLVRTLTAIAALSCSSASFAQQETGPGNPPGRDAGQTTSDRTPGKETKTPAEQTTSVDGKTSDRSPGTPQGENADQKTTGASAETPPNDTQ